MQAEDTYAATDSTKYLTSKLFFETLVEHDGNLKSIGEYEVTEVIYFLETNIPGDILLGNGTFTKKVNFRKLDLGRHSIFLGACTFRDELHFSASKFCHLDFEVSCLLENVYLGDINVDSINFGGALFSKAFICGRESSVVKLLDLYHRPTFNAVIADERPDIAWVIQQYKDSDTHYEIAHAPVHYQLSSSK